jgi:hypothetical protein
MTPVPLNESTPLEKVNLQIQRIFYSELKKYDDFYFDTHSPSPSIPVITDSETDANGNLVVIGEYSYTNDYYVDQVKHVTPNRSFKFKATVKKILDENKVSAIVYLKGDSWYRLFPANE